MEDAYKLEDFTYLIIILFYNKVHPDLEDFLLIDLSPKSNSELITLNATEMKLYNKFIIYCAVRRQKNNDLLWSNTYTIQGDFEVYDN